MNRRFPDGRQPDRAYAFQAEIEVATEHGFVPRPDLRVYRTRFLGHKFGLRGLA